MLTKLLVLILIGLGDDHRLAIMLLSILASWHVAGDRMRPCRRRVVPILLEAASGWFGLARGLVFTVGMINDARTRKDTIRK